MPESLQPQPKALCMLRTSKPLCICQKSTSWFQMPSCHSGYINQQVLIECSLCAHSPEDLGPGRLPTRNTDLHAWFWPLFFSICSHLSGLPWQDSQTGGSGQQTCIISQFWRTSSRSRHLQGYVFWSLPHCLQMVVFSLCLHVVFLLEYLCPNLL